MSPLVKKEIRLLLPAWIAAMLLGVLASWAAWAWAWVMDFAFLESWWSTVVPPILALGLALLGIAAFGQEFNSNAFGILLSQPFERRRIWRIKTRALAVAFFSVWLAVLLSAAGQFYLSKRYYFHWDPNLATGLTFEVSQALESLAICAAVMFSGGLWTTLLLRQITGAFWFTLLCPCAIMLGIGAILNGWIASGKNINAILGIALLLYSIAGFFVARWLFLRAQDTQWTGGEVSFSWFKKSTVTRPMSVSLRPRHRIAALIGKEIHLHQANFLIAAFILVLHLVSVLVRKIHPHFENPDTQFIFDSIGILWGLMPILIGCAAIAEERRLGVMESQLCLAVSRRMQLLIKFFVALILSLLLGGFIPLLIEGALKLDYAIFVVVAVIFFIAFYASSGAHTTLQAIGLAIACGLIISGYETATAGVVLVRNYYMAAGEGLEVLKLYLGVPLLVLVLGGLIFWNFKWLHPDRKLWSRNAIAILAAFASIFILTNAVYFRVWEWVMPSEPRGPARLNDSAQIRFAQQNFDALYTTLPDGRLWAATLAFEEISNHWWQSTVIVPDQIRAEFLGGSNWADVTADRFQAVGVQSNGTLWAIQKNWSTRPDRSESAPFAVTQIGSETDWARAAGGSFGFLLLKKDGSLWLCETHAYKRRNPGSIPRSFKSDLDTSPVQVENGRDWKEVIPSSMRAFAQKADGSRWTWGWRRGAGTNLILTVVQETNLDNQWSNIAFLENVSFVGVKTNGQLWLYSAIIQNQTKPAGIQGRYHKYQLGLGSKWKIAVGRWDYILAIREDGTLWKWPRRWGLTTETPVQLGNHSDWVSLTGGWMGTFALASDGSLWAWEQPSRHVWLAPPRRPTCVGNIFQGR